MKKFRKLWLLLALGLMLAGCGSGKTAEKEPEAVVAEDAASEEAAVPDEQQESAEPETEESNLPEPEESISERRGESEPAETVYGKARQSESGGITGSNAAAEEISYIDIPVYAGDAYTEINGNVPYFDEEDMTDVSYEYYSELDSLGRCGACMASVGQDIMPVEERGKIGSVKPTGWHTVKYEGVVDGNYLYNRCHLLGFQLTGENANVQNLITGTRYMNVKGMLPFENMVADYVKETGNHVMYRVTPLFEGDNLLADGVLMEAKSVEDDGEDILFNVFCYNVQPGVSIDYATGTSSLDGTVSVAASEPQEQNNAGQQEQQVEQQSEIQPQSQPEPQQPAASAGGGTYAVNGKNGKIHIVGGCAATGNSKNAMSQPVYFDTYEEAEAYSALIEPDESERKCKNCW